MRMPPLRMHAEEIRCRQPVNVQQKHPPTEWNCSKKIFVPVFPFSSSVRSTIGSCKHTRNYKNSRRLVLFRWPSRTARRQYLAFGVHRNANKMPLHTVGVNSDNLCIRGEPYFLCRGQFAHLIRLHFRCSNIIPYIMNPTSLRRRSSHLFFEILLSSSARILSKRP